MLIRDTHSYSSQDQQADPLSELTPTPTTVFSLGLWGKRKVKAMEGAYSRGRTPHRSLNDAVYAGVSPRQGDELEAR